jgi:hypothetical protein
MKSVPLLSTELQKGNAWIWESYRQLCEETRGIKAKYYKIFGIDRQIPLTVPQQWNNVRRNSYSLLRNLPEVKGPPILFLTVWGGRCSPILSAIESILAEAVRLRGARAISIMCDKALPSCSFDPLGNHSLTIPNGYASTGYSAIRCRECTRSIRAYYQHSSIELERFSRFAKSDDLARALRIVDNSPNDNYQDFIYRDIKVGEHALASALRDTGRGTLLDDPYHKWLLRRHLISAIMITDLTERVLEAFRPRRIVAPHGIYVDHGTICEVARKHGVPVAVFSVSYRRDTVMLCHGDTYHRTLVTEPTALWEDLELNREQEQRLENYIDSRRDGSQDNLTYHPNPLEDNETIFQELSLDKKKPIISLFSNVMWDAQIYHGYNAFDSMVDWVFQTIDYFKRRSELQLVIRVHPAEAKAVKKSEQRLDAEIAKRFPVLSDNIKVIQPESDISSYSLVEISRAALIYGTKMGLEIALRGVPVIIAGESMLRHKGISYDVETPEQYFNLLDRITDLPRNSPNVLSRAQKYGYHFYFRRQINFPFVTGYRTGRQVDLELKLTFDSLNDLLPGKHINLDKICDGLLNGTEFVVN